MATPNASHSAGNAVRDTVIDGSGRMEAAPIAVK